MFISSNISVPALAVPLQSCTSFMWCTFHPASAGGGLPSVGALSPSAHQLMLLEGQGLDEEALRGGFLGASASSDSEREPASFSGPGSMADHAPASSQALAAQHARALAQGGAQAVGPGGVAQVQRRPLTRRQMMLMGLTVNQQGGD